MNSNKEAILKHTKTGELVSLIVDSILDKKGKDVIELDLRVLDEAPTDHFIICHGNSTVQVKAIADHILAETREKIGVRPNHVEGQQNSSWILIDYFDTVVHLFNEEAREFYSLEHLWSDAKMTKHSDDTEVESE